MRLPSFGEVIGIIATLVVGLTAAGKGHVVWDAIHEMRKRAATAAARP